MGRRFRRLRQVARQFVRLIRRIVRVCPRCVGVEHSYEIEVVPVERLFYGNIPDLRIIPGVCGQCDRAEVTQPGWESPDEAATRYEDSDWLSPDGTEKTSDNDQAKVPLHQKASDQNLARGVPNYVLRPSRDHVELHEERLDQEELPSAKHHYDHTTWDSWYTSYPIGWKAESQLYDGEFGQRAVVSDRDNKKYFLKVKDAKTSTTELSFLADLQCGFVTRLLASFVREDRRFSFMEYYPLGNLDHWLQLDPKRKHFKEDVAVNISSSLYIALDFLHDAGVLHLNVSAANILINQLGFPILCGFGRARSIRSCESTSIDDPLTSTYIPPERYQGRLPNKLTDLWAVACCLYEIIKGKSPFNGKSLGDTEFNNSLVMVPDLDGLSTTASDFLSSALNISWQHREGFYDDTVAFYRHDLFSNINWSSVKCGGFIHEKSPLLSICDSLSQTTRTSDRRIQSSPISQPTLARKGDNRSTDLPTTSEGQMKRKRSYTRRRGRGQPLESSDSDEGCKSPAPPRRRLQRRDLKRKMIGQKYRSRGEGYIGDGEESE